MEALVRVLTRRRSGNVGTRDTEVSCAAIRFGRSADSEAYLADPRIRLHQATLHSRPNGLFFEAVEQTDLFVNDQATRAATVQPGDRIGLGPYEVVIIDPPPGKDVAVTVELVRQLGDDLEKLQARSRITLAAAGLGKRRWAWALAVVVLGLFLAWPVADYLATGTSPDRVDPPRPGEPKQARTWPMAPDLAWISGEVSGPHKFFGDNCGVCHQTAFVKVQDAACVACHAEIEHHADPAKFTFPELTDGLCQNCHKEHFGLAPIVRNDQKFCAGCHGRLKALAPNTGLLDATDFGDVHPEFRPAVAVDAAAGKRQRLALDKANWPVERSNLKFPHKKHLKAEGVKTPEQPEKKVLQCGDCHRLDAGSVGMQPIDMERDCKACHQLKFEPKAPDFAVPHGDVKGVLRSLQGFYGQMALRGGFEDAAAPPSVRRRTGTTLTEDERIEALAWAQDRAAQAADYLYGKAVCGVCHEVTRADGGWGVKPVLLADRWFGKGLFHHGHHATMECVDCHQAPESEVAGDVLLPGVETCQNCHGGEQAADRVPSTCIACHEFHQPFLGPMRPELAKAAAGAK